MSYNQVIKMTLIKIEDKIQELICSQVFISMKYKILELPNEKLIKN